MVWLIACLLLAGYGGMCLKIAHDTSPTFDEPDHVAVGYYTLVTGYRPYNNINLTFTQMWSALPLLLAKTAPEIELMPEANPPQPSPSGASAPAVKYRPVTGVARLVRWLVPIRLFDQAPHFPTTAEQQAGQASGINFGRMFYFDPHNDTEKIIFWSRAMITVLAVALGAVLFLWSRRLWGDLAGLVTLAFYCLNPQTIALGSFATTDIASTLFFTLAAAAVWRLLQRVSLPNLLLAGIVAGVLAATKISSLFLLPVAGLMLIVRLAIRRPLEWKLPFQPAVPGPAGWLPRLAVLSAALAGAVLIAYATLWSFYGFRYAATDTPVPEAVWKSSNLVKAHVAPVLIQFSRDHHLFPEAYLYDLHQFTTTSSVRRAFVLGEYSVDGWWYFFPVAWLSKTPLPFMLALAAGVVLLWRARREQAAALWSLVPLLALGAVYGAATISSNLNIGARHLLPLYPLLFLLAGFATRLPLAAWRRPVWIGGLVAWSAAEAAAVHPHYLAYFNELAGGSAHGNRILVDSSYEWGEGLPDVRRWLEARTERLKDQPPLPVYFSYFGCADLTHYGLRPINKPGDSGNILLLPSFYDQRPPQNYDLNPGTYVISATMLNGLYGAHTMGPWRPSYEETYQRATQEMRRLREAMRDEATLNAFLEKEGREQIKLQAQQQITAADDPKVLLRARAIELAKTAYEQANKTDEVAKNFPLPPARDDFYEQEGRKLIKQQAQQQIAAADHTPLARDQAIQIARSAYEQAKKTDEVAKSYPLPLDRDNFFEREGQKLVEQQLQQQFIVYARNNWLQTISLHDQLRFSRLCAYLRAREPEARIGYGFLVFELKREELDAALSGPPAELKRDYFVKGTENRTEAEIDFIR